MKKLCDVINSDSGGVNSDAILSAGVMSHLRHNGCSASRCWKLYSEEVNNGTNNVATCQGGTLQDELNLTKQPMDGTFMQSGEIVTSHGSLQRMRDDGSWTARWAMNALRVGSCPNESERALQIFGLHNSIAGHRIVIADVPDAGSPQGLTAIGRASISSVQRTSLSGCPLSSIEIINFLWQSV